MLALSPTAQTPDGITTEGYKPSRRVRSVPGGPSSDIFGNAVDEGVLAIAPQKGEVQVLPVHSDSVQYT